MAYAARELASRPGMVFARRVITRDGNAGGEDPDAVSQREFEELDRAGRFAVSWQAPGLHYGIPAAAADAIASWRLRSEARRGGTACVGPYRSRGSPAH